MSKREMGWGSLSPPALEAAIQLQSAAPRAHDTVVSGLLGGCKVRA
jgi:hypothetical protein